MEDQNQIKTESIPKMVAAGTAIGIGAIALFGLLWFGLGQLGVETLIRLAMAVCIPPAVMTIAIFFLYLRQQSKY